MGIAELDHRRHDLLGDELWDRLKREEIDTCKTCHGEGMVVTGVEYDDDGFPESTEELCKCRVQCLWKLELHYAGVPIELWEADKIEPEFNVERFEELREYAENIENAIQHGLGLVLHGDNGSGKSSSATIPVIAAIKKRKTTAFINWPDFIEGRRRAFKDDDLSKHLDDRIMKDLVVLDEVGKEFMGKDANFVIQKLDSLLRMRRGSELPTIITTNFGVNDFSTQYGKSVMSLLSDTFKFLRYDPSDFRKTRSLSSWDKKLKGGR